MCVDGIDAFTCNCDAGYDGTLCDNDIDECAPKPCVHGQCVDAINAFTCDCSATGYFGELCELDIDECADGLDACVLNATCTNEVGTYSCACNTGYEGNPKTECTDIDGCQDSPCYANVACTDAKAPALGFSCGPCPDQTFGDGIQCDACSTCEDNEWAKEPCLPIKNTICETCITCAPGEVETSPCTKITNRICEACEPGTYEEKGSCIACALGEISTAGATTCTPCPAGQAEIEDNLCTPCAPGSISDEGATECTTCAPGTYDAGNNTCTACEPGTISSDGETLCTPCSAGSFDAGNNACELCPSGQSSTDGSSKCTPCYPGTYAEEGEPFCSPCPLGTFAPDSGLGACTPCDFSETHCLPALNTCDPIDGKLTPCDECEPGYEGELCTQEIDECEDEPCQNGGVCVDGLASFACQCPKWTAGEICDEIIDVTPPTVDDKSLPNAGEHGKNKTFNATIAVSDDLSGVQGLTWIYDEETLKEENNLEPDGGSFSIQIVASSQVGTKATLEVELKDIAGNTVKTPLFTVETIQKDVVCYGCGQNVVVIPKTCYNTCYDSCESCSPKYCPDNPNCTWCCNQDYIDPQCE